MTEERRRTIEQLVTTNAEVTLNELETVFPSVSSMTLRRDLIYLEKMGIVRRTRGGAISVSRLNKPYEDAFSRRAHRDVIAKRAICREALRLFAPDTTIYIDSGSTLLHFAQMMPDVNCLVITTGPNITLELAGKSRTEVMQLGGRIRSNTLSVSGEWTMSALRTVNIDIAFMGTSGFTLQNGFTSGSVEESEIKRMVLNKAKTRVMLMDHSKIDRVLPFTFTGLGNIDYLLCNEPLPSDIMTATNDHNTNVIIAEESAE